MPLGPHVLGFCRPEANAIKALSSRLKTDLRSLYCMADTPVCFNSA